MLPLLAALLASPALTYRTAQVDVTPPELLPLGGYTARGDKVMEAGGEKLYARTIVFEKGEKKVAVVSFEALTIPESLVTAVEGKIPADVHLMLVATHTHSAPDSQMLNERMTFRIPGIATFSRRWLEWYATKIAASVTDALAAKPLAIESLTLSQREVDANRGRREGAAPIKTATYILDGGRPLLTVYAAHGTVLDEKQMTTSGDWLGMYAAKVGGLVLPGAIGDVSPNFSGIGPVENLASMVEKLRPTSQGAEGKGALTADSELAFVQEPIRLDPAKPSPAFAKEFGAAPPLDQVLIGRFAPPMARVTLVRVGPLVLVGVPGEPTSEVGRAIEALGKKSGFPHSVAVSHTNGWIGYVLMPEDYDRGGYEAALSFNGRETASRVTEAVERAFRRLAQPESRVAQTR